MNKLSVARRRPHLRKQKWLDREHDRLRSLNLRKERSLPIHPVRVGSGVIRYVETELLPRVDLGRKHRNARRLLEQMMAIQLVAEQAGRVLACSCDNSDSGARTRTKLLNQLVTLGVLIHQKGSENSGMVSRYAFSRQGYRIASQYVRQVTDAINVDVKPTKKVRPDMLDLEMAPVVLRNEHKLAVQFKRTMAIKDLERRITEINRQNLLHTYIFSRQLSQANRLQQAITNVRAIFNRDFKHGGRLYSFTINGYTSLKKQDRRTMLIDGEPIAEFDFSGHHPRMLYHLQGLDPQGDVYRTQIILPEIKGDSGPKTREKRKSGLRRAVKHALLIVLNSLSRRGAAIALDQWLSLEKQTAIKTQLQALGITASCLVNRTLQAHAPIRHHFFTNIGLTIQASHELPLMLNILETIQQSGGPALSMHDGVICKKCDLAITQAAMSDCYRSMFGFLPVITRDY